MYKYIRSRITIIIIIIIWQRKVSANVKLQLNKATAVKFKR